MLPPLLSRQAGAYTALRTLIESAFKANGNTPAIIISHSMGNHVALAFLHRQTPAWR